MSRRSTTAVMPFRKKVLGVLTPDRNKFRINNRREMSAESRTISDYRQVSKHRFLTKKEKIELYSAIETERKSGRHWDIQTGIDCGVYSLTSLVPTGQQSI
jgi:hypothetical protein